MCSLSTFFFFGLRIFLVISCAEAAHADTLPPVPIPRDNPITEEKRVLGKILFWDEQLSSDNTVACGTCHRPSFGGADPREALSSGVDGKWGTDDDTVGSPGIRLYGPNRSLRPASKETTELQSTLRATPSYFMAAWAEDIFWDGRAGPQFRDPLTHDVLLPSGGALENQALGPLLNPVEMAHEGRDWTDVVSILARIRPLALATNLPSDVQSALSDVSTYATLFERAFGDPSITPARLAFAIATYERTLIADQTPWDQSYFQPNSAPEEVRQGFMWFKFHQCDACHVPPLFTNNDFINAGVRPAHMDRGRQVYSHSAEDAGDMKVPSLRNVGLRKRFMHTGTFRTLDEVFDLYANPKAPADPLPTTGNRYVVRMTETARHLIKQFLTEGLTDPRVAAEVFPFDRPTLRSERYPSDTQAPSATQYVLSHRVGSSVTLTWNASNDNTQVVDYMITQGTRVLGYTTMTHFVDESAGKLLPRLYKIVARDAAVNQSTDTIVVVWPPAIVIVGLFFAFTLVLAKPWKLRINLSGSRLDDARSHDY